MAEISAQKVKELRDVTGAGMMDCKVALAENNGDFEKAIDFLKKKGLKSVGKRADKVASEGIVFCYTHPGSRIAVMLELNCETDFVARGDDFNKLAKDIAMHIAWASPKYVRREEVPTDILDREKEIFKSQLKPGQENVAEKIIAGKIDKYYSEICLIEQLDAKDSSGKKTIGDLVIDLSAKIGEKVQVRRFSRYEVGEGIEKQKIDYVAEVEAAARV
ncbi:MAG: translation elongation factor Ts [Proteobacteria bacterium]|nr:translation elongation factor Ts [Pseudomonadota bacterium]